jgi:hypothetical protein
MTRIENAKRNTDKTNSSNRVERPIPIRPIRKKMNPTFKGCRLSNFDTNQPENGNPSNELIGRIKRKLPRVASSIAKVAFKVGILDAHVEKQNPDKKKKMLSAIRFFSLLFMLNKYAQR